MMRMVSIAATVAGSPFLQRRVGPQDYRRLLSDRAQVAAYRRVIIRYLPEPSESGPPLRSSLTLTTGRATGTRCPSKSKVAWPNRGGNG